MKTFSISQFRKQVLNGEISIVEHTQRVLDEVQKQNKKFHYFCLIAQNEAIAQARDLDKKLKKNPGEFKNAKLLGVPLSVKDSIIVHGIESRAGSAILNGYVPLFDATAVVKAKEQGAIVIGKTSQDEFGFGSFSVNVGNGFEVPLNPWDTSRTCGGSSGGSAGYSALTQFTHASLGESTGGSAPFPAAFCGVASITPTYGRVSRNGLIDFGNSLDKISPMGKTIADAAEVLEAIAGFDPADSTSADIGVEPFAKAIGKPVKGMKIGVIKEFRKEGIDAPVQNAFENTLGELEKQGAKISEVSMPLNSKYSIPTYFLMGGSELSTNLAKYCGLRYGASEKLQGSFNEYFMAVRSKNFGEEAKRRILLGTFARMSGFRDAYYSRALKIRSKLIREFQQAFQKTDVLVTPTSATLPPMFSEIKKWSPLQHYYSDRCVNPPNTSGLPHASVNIASHMGLPIGMLFIGNHWQESKVIQAASAAEKIFEGNK